MNERSFFYELGRLVYQIDGAYEEYGRRAHVSSPNLLWILYALNDGARHSQKQICEDWAIPRSTANTLIKDLEGKGYVTLSQIKGERRELLISLTESGKKYADGVLSDLYMREKEVYADLASPGSTLEVLRELAVNIKKIVTE